MKYGIIGAGNVGLTFAHYLSISDKNFLVFTHSINEKSSVFRYIPESTFTEDFDYLVHNSDTIFIATPDYAIEKTIDSINDISKQKNIVVFSGSFSSKEKRIYNLHPAASIPQPVFDDNFVKEIVFTAKSSPFIEKLKNDLQIQIVYISNYSPLYHAGAMMASNFITILLFAAENILKNFTKNKNDTKRLMKSFSFTGLNAYFEKHKISGPISRGDLSTIDNHKSALRGKKEGIIYRALIKYGVNHLNAKK
ncbi:DUF2520 domain-containing protein [candidate division WOR-3 bacterium]|nr:DUF2520 domain-containing protein [candidate division WOR-3 bacterium]